MEVVESLRKETLEEMEVWLSRTPRRSVSPLSRTSLRVGSQWFRRLLLGVGTDSPFGRLRRVVVE